MPPRARGLALVITLLPALQPVRSGAFLLSLDGVALLRFARGAKALLEHVEQLWNVVDELHRRERRGGGQLRVGVDRLAPRRKDRCAPRAQVSRESRKDIGRSHLG